jgi:hypothetical protein
MIISSGFFVHLKLRPDLFQPLMQSFIAFFGGDPESMMSSLNEAIIDIKESHVKCLPVVTQLLGKTAGTTERPP